MTLDVYWSPEGVDFAKLKQRDPILLDLSLKGRALHKKYYGGELFYSKTFLTLFQRTRAGTEKGITALDLRRLQ